MRVIDDYQLNCGFVGTRRGVFLRKMLYISGESYIIEQTPKTGARQECSRSDPEHSGLFYH